MWVVAAVLWRQIAEAIDQRQRVPEEASIVQAAGARGLLPKLRPASSEILT